MTKLLEFPKQHKRTWGEAIQAMVDEADEETLNSPVTNLLMISINKQDYNFGILNDTDLRDLIGTMECVKHYFISMIQDVTTYDYGDE